MPPTTLQNVTITNFSASVTESPTDHTDNSPTDREQEKATKPSVAEAIAYAEALVADYDKTAVQSYRFDRCQNIYFFALQGKHSAVIGAARCDCPLKAVQDADNDRKYRSLLKNPVQIVNIAALCAVKAGGAGNGAFSTIGFIDEAKAIEDVNLTTFQANDLLTQSRRLVRLEGQNMWFLLPGTSQTYKNNDYLDGVAGILREQLLGSLRLPRHVIGV